MKLFAHTLAFSAVSLIALGVAFNFNGAPNRYGLDPFYELHVWAWKPNLRGTFADVNPKVSCEHAHGK